MLLILSLIEIIILALFYPASHLTWTFNSLECDNFVTFLEVCGEKSHPTPHALDFLIANCFDVTYAILDIRSRMASSQPVKPPLASQPPQAQRGASPGLRYPSSSKTIYHRPLNRSRTQELSQASFAYLFGEMVSYAQRRVTGIQDLEKRCGSSVPTPPFSTSMDIFYDASIQR